MKALQFVDEELAKLKEQDLYRETYCVQSAQGRTVVVDGRELVCFSANNYLDLAGDPRVRRAAARAAEQFGAGATASRLANGTMLLHEELERRLATFEQAEACVLFPTGYMANVGTIAALVGRGDAVIADRLSHASLIDGCRLSGAQFRVYPHSDAAALGKALARLKGVRRTLVVTDGVFSMDGDLAPLREIVEVTRRYEALLLVDDAHGTGVLGEGGRGTVELLGVEGRVEVRVGTLSKALGSLGGFVVGSRALIEYLKNRARTFIYATALPPPALAAALAALDIVELEPERRERLLSLAKLAREQLSAVGLKVLAGPTPIVPVLLGESRRALELSAHLRERGFLVPAIRPPTVPRGTARLRVSLSCSHAEDDVRGLAHACKDWVCLADRP